MHQPPATQTSEWLVIKTSTIALSLSLPKMTAASASGDPLSYFVGFPHIQHCIFGSLAYPALKHCRLVCSEWRHFVDQELDRPKGRLKEDYLTRCWSEQKFNITLLDGEREIA